MTMHSQYGKRQHAVTELDGQGFDGHLLSLTDKNEKRIKTK